MHKHPIKSIIMSGFTLVELMIAIAIASVIVAIAIPAYDGYITEARIATARSNVDSLRLFLEDYRLDNGTYVGPNGNLTTLAQITTDYGWNPRQNDSGYAYALNVTANTYSINVTFAGQSIVCDQSNNCTY